MFVCVNVRPYAISLAIGEATVLSGWPHYGLKIKEIGDGYMHVEEKINLYGTLSDNFVLYQIRGMQKG